jgi:alpha-glucosidase (family GH31 glycosyl hydrolase)
LCVLTSYGQSLSHLFFSSACECWPWLVVFPDFTQSKVRTWWAELVKEFVSNDIDGIWNDMNEPAVFKVTQTVIPLPTSTSLLIVYISRNMAYQHKIIYFLSLYGCRLSGFAACGLCQCCDRKEGCCVWVMNRQYQRQCQSRIYTKETKTWVALNRTLTTTMCTLQSFLSFFFLVS